MVSNEPPQDNSDDIAKRSLEALLEIEKLLKKDEGMQSRAGVSGFPTTNAASRRVSDSKGLGGDIFRSFMGRTTPSLDYASSTFTLNSFSKRGPGIRAGYLAAGSLQEAARTFSGGNEYAAKQYGSYSVAKDGVTDARVRAGTGEGGRFVKATSDPKAVSKIHDLATKEVNNGGLGLSTEQFNQILRGEAPMDDLRQQVEQHGDAAMKKEMDQMATGGGARYAALRGGRILEQGVRIADTASRTLQAASAGLDKLYAPASAAAGLGYGMPTIGGITAPIGLGQGFSGPYEVAQRGIMNKAASMLPGLSGQQAKDIQSVIQQSGYGQAGQEGAYRSLFGGMASITRQTGGALAPQSQMQVAEMALRSGRGTQSMTELIKLLGTDLPKAANASRMSIQQMHDTIMKTVQQVSQNQFNIMTPSQIYERTTSAMGSGAQPDVGKLLSGQNQMLDIRAASLSGQSLASLDYNPLAATYRGEALGQTIGKLFPGIQNTGDLYKMQQSNPDQFARNMQMLKQYGVDTQTLFGYFNQDNKGVQAATTLGGLAQFQTTKEGHTETNFLGSLPFGIGSAVGESKTVGSKVLTAGNVEIDPNQAGGAKLVYEKNKQAVDYALSNMQGNDKKDFSQRLNEIMSSNGTAGDLQKLFTDTQSKLSGKNAKDQSSGKNVTVTLTLDPNGQASRMMNFQYQNQASKSLVINGNSGATMPGSLAAAQQGLGGGN
jgi:hypothetical protein